MPISARAAEVLPCSRLCMSQLRRGEELLEELCQEGAKASCCAKDEGKAFEAAL